MKFAGIKFICRLLIASLVLLQFSVAQAGMIGADQVLSPAAVQLDRSNVSSVLGRSEVASQLQSMGVDPKLAQDRVAAMTDSEVHALAGNLDAMPAGAMFAGGWWLVAALVIGLVVYFNWKR
jgi:hypothetical protein